MNSGVLYVRNSWSDTVHSLDLSLVATLGFAIGAAGYAVEDDRDLLQASASRSLRFSDLNLSISKSVSDRLSLLSLAYSDSVISAGDFLLDGRRSPSFGAIL